MKKTATGVTRKKSWNHAQCIFFLAGIGVALTLFIGLTLYLFVLLDIPDLKSVRDYEPKMTTVILARDNRIVREIFEENRKVVPLAEMPELLPRAFVAAEDARFFEHPGVDLWSIFRALFHNLRAGARARAAVPLPSR